ncbi:Uma2 family endonuclease [Rubrivirga sp.]|uniref:Uma2 family endonuclease n=1 Tax=Rubrivirga sp. TaxID=1885344 RepID=UPI003C74BA1A
MPVVAPRTLTMSPEDYFEWEASQTERHEFHFGEVFPMSGGTSAHAEIIIALGSLLYAELRGTEYKVRSEAMRVQISGDEYVYPDLSVTRGPGTFRSTRKITLLDPVLIVEVLSPSTRSYDYGEKLALYRSVEDVLLVDSQRRHVEVVRRTDDGWTLSGALEGVASLRSVGVDLEVEDLYRDVTGFEDA